MEEIIRKYVTEHVANAINECNGTVWEFERCFQSQLPSEARAVKDVKTIGKNVWIMDSDGKERFMVVGQLYHVNKQKILFLLCLKEEWRSVKQKEDDSFLQSFVTITPYNNLNFEVIPDVPVFVLMSEASENDPESKVLRQLYIRSGKLIPRLLLTS